MKFKIGEFSKYNRVTVKTLRYYEEIGLLLPAEIDEWTGYRYYNETQIASMSKIKKLKYLGFSLEEIKSIFPNMPSGEKIGEKIEEANSEKMRIEERIAALTQLLENKKGEETMQECIIKTLPEVIVASHRTILSSYAELTHLMPNVLGKEMHRLNCKCAQPDYCFNLYHDCEYKEKDIDCEICQAVEEKGVDSDIIQFKVLPEVPIAVCILHKGAYETLGESYAKIFREIETLGYEINGLAREHYIDGIWSGLQPCDYLTEIQVPVKKK